MNNADLTTKNSDFDTLGGRISRARDVQNQSLTQVAKMVGVELNTLKSWENDQSEPRSNRLAMLAGILGTSPTWLLYGRGTAPVSETASSDAESIRKELEELTVEHEKISNRIENAEDSLRQLESEARA